MPLRPVAGTLVLPLDSTDDALVLFETARSLSDEPNLVRRRWKARDLADHFYYLGAVRPDLSAHLRSRWSRLTDEELGGVPLRFCDWVPLLQGADDDDADRLASSVDALPNGLHLEMLAAIGTPHANERLASLAREHGLIAEVEALGIAVPQGQGPARRRFAPRWAAIRKVPVHVEPDALRSMVHPIGLELRDVASKDDDTIRWHYLSIDLAEVEGLPPLSFGRIHLVGPKEVCVWSLFCGVDADGRYQTLSLETDPRPGDEDEDDEEDLLEGRDNDAEGDLGRAEILPPDAGLTYCNGHVLHTEGVVGTIGGPPLGLYPNPKCRACGRLMFHLLTVDARVREYGDGFRSLFLCEACGLVCCAATSYN